MACVAGLPPGILFAPEDEVAVEHYLLPRLLGLPLPIDGLILNDDPLSAPPQELLERNGRSEEAFFFAEGQARCGKGTRQKRTCAGGGWWEGQKTCAEGSKLRLPCSDEEAAWRKTVLNFHCGGSDGKKGSTGWVMHEYAVTAPEVLAQSPLRLYHIRLSSYGRKQSGAMEVPRALGFAPGFLFAPEDGDAVAHYLLPRLLGQPLPLDGLIVDDDPLSAPPWELLVRNGRKEDAFFFGLGQVKNSKGSRQKRTCAGGGFWNGERTCVDGEQLHIPCLGGGVEVMTWRMKALSFQDGGEKGSTGWVMHEYAITAPDYLAESQLMLYRIRFSGHGKKRKRGEADPFAGEAAPPAARRRVAEDALFSMTTSDPICSSIVQADQADGNCVNGAEHHVEPVTVPAEQNNTPATDDRSWDLGFWENLDIDDLLSSIELPSPNPGVLPADPVMHHGCMEPADPVFFPMPNQSYAAC